MVLRCINDGIYWIVFYSLLTIFLLDKGKVENINQSVQLAKEAVGYDLKDGESWCNILPFCFNF